MLTINLITAKRILELTDGIKTVCISLDTGERVFNNCIDDKGLEHDDEGKFTGNGRNDTPEKFFGKTPVSEIPEDNEILKKGEKLSDTPVEVMRKRAETFYIKYLNGECFENPGLKGKIKFSLTADKKPISFSADKRKLLVVPALPDILKKGIVGDLEPDRYKRKNIAGVYKIRGITKTSEGEFKVVVQIRKDNNGQLYYDHFIAK